MNESSRREQRISRMARRAARIVLELKREGEHDGARRFETVVIEVADKMRRGEL